MAEKKESIVQFSKRLKSLVPVGSGRDFAKKAGIGYSTVHNYLQAISSPTLENLVQLAKAGGVSVEWLATGEESAQSSDKSKGGRLLKIPFIDNNDFLLLDSNTFPNLQKKIDTLTALRVTTDVMDTTFTVGSILLIDQNQKQLKEGKIVVFYKEGNYLYKRVQILSNGYNLSSDNKKYNDIIVKEDSLYSFNLLGEVLLVINSL